MLIQRMSAAFGRLRNETIQLQGGLNILEAPNEAGKSTWCAFLTAMLYGVNSRERDRAGFIAEKNRYAPWSGAAMAGRLDCRAGGVDLTITRSTRRQTAPMAEFQAVYADTGTVVDGLSGANCGETLLGVSREVFERSAFIRQSGLAISQDAGLERRITSLISSGEEDTSYTEAYDVLKKQLNRRRFNRSGQLPALEAELTEVRGQLSAAESIQQQLAETQVQSQALEASTASLADELARHDRWDAAQKYRQLEQLAADADAAAQHTQALENQLEADHIPDTETIGRLRGAIVNLETVRKSAAKARADKDESMKALLRAEKAVSEFPFSGQTAEDARQEASVPPKVSFNAAPSLVVFFLMLAIAAGITMFTISRSLLTGWEKVLPWGIFAAILATAGILSRQMQKRAIKRAQSAALVKRFGTADPSEIAALAESYIHALEIRDAAQADANAKSAISEALYTSLTTNEQAILLEVRRFAPSAFDISTADQVLRNAGQRRRALAEAQSAAREAATRRDLLAQENLPEETGPKVEKPVRSRDVVAAQLDEARSRLAALHSAADRLSGQLHAMGDPSLLLASAENIQDRITQLQGEYDALHLAMEALTGANTAIQNRFSPQLSRRTAEIFQELTEGRYTGAALDRSFHLTAQPAGDPIDRDIQLLSAGTADQLYLAARLAICQLVLPAEKEIPLILDDALANFDDDRCAAALRWLRREAEHRQILLFTCHSREAVFFSGDSAVSVQELGA
nr:AAA family ATPase [uncultured Dysosmobacter sp.]